MDTHIISIGKISIADTTMFGSLIFTGETIFVFGSLDTHITSISKISIADTTIFGSLIFTGETIFVFGSMV